MKKTFAFSPVKIFMTAALLLTAAVTMSFSLQNVGGGYKIGDTAQDFNLKNVNGKNVSLAGIKNAKGYIVIFTCNHCPYAKAYEQRIIELHQKYAPLGFSVVAINSNDKDVQPADSFDNMKKLAKQKKYPFPYLYDESQEVAKTFGATRTPHVYVLDKDRVVRYIGAIDDNSEDPGLAKEKYVGSAVEALLGGQEVAVKETKAIGCGIKWKKS
ncbi:MAG: thioredoxin family protein [Saprospiraceae bacterium]|nr:thioredoxin family protein [Saprospiraceae bacterium]